MAEGDLFMAKNGNVRSFVAIVSIVVTLGLAGMAVVKSYYVLPVKVASQTEQVDKLEADIEKVEDECRKTVNDVIEIKTDIKYLREDTQEILQYIRSLPK